MRVVRRMFLVLVGVFGLSACGSPVSSDEPAVLGRYEPVAIAVQPGEPPVVVQAKIDTASELSSIDRTVAEELGIDVAGADTLSVVNGVGREDRPVVAVTMTIGDIALDTRVTVADRADLTTAVGIGRADLDPFVIDPNRSHLTEPVGIGQARLVANSQLTLDGILLLTVLPVMALLVIVFRSVIGLSTVGLFTPVLVALAFAQARSWVLVGIFVAMLAAGFLIQPVMQRLELTRVARLGLLLISQVLVMKVAYSSFGASAILDWVVAVPVIITLGMIENLWETSRREGFRSAATSAVYTVLLILVTTSILMQPTLLGAMYNHPFITTVLCAAGCVLLGRYHGLRLTEAVRFRQLRAARV